VIAKLDEMDDLTRRTAIGPAFHRYVLKILRPAFERVGWEGVATQSSQTVLLRAALIGALGRFGDERVVAACKRRFAAFLKLQASLAPDLRAAVFQTVGRYADEKAFAELRQLGEAAPATEDKLRYYYALAGAQNAHFIDQDMQIALTGEIANGRVDRFLLEVAHESNRPDLVWHTLLGVRAGILGKLSAEQRGQLLPAIAQESANPVIARELLSLPETQASNGARYRAAKAVARVLEQSEFKRRLLPELRQWLLVH
jgi:hypothetical protein